MTKTKIVGLALAMLVAGTLAGCSPNIPETGSKAESDYIVACAKAGGTFVPGRETPGSSYRSACLFRYPALPNNN